VYAHQSKAVWEDQCYVKRGEEKSEAHEEKIRVRAWDQGGSPGWGEGGKEGLSAC